VIHDLRDRDPLYMDDIAPLLYAERQKSPKPRIEVRVTREQFADLCERFKQQAPFSTGDPFAGAVSFLFE
jgi:hypothetical protein